MFPSMVRNQVESSLAKSGEKAFCVRMTALADEHGIVLFQEDLDGLIVLAQRYVRGTMRLLENCETASRQGRVEAMFEPLITASSAFFLRPPALATDQNGLLGMIINSYMARSLLSIASNRMQTVRGFPLFATAPHDEEPLVRMMLGETLAGQLYDHAEHIHDSPQIRFYSNSAYLLQSPLRASANVSDWGGTLMDDAVKFTKSVGLNIDGGPSSATRPAPRAASTF